MSGVLLYKGLHVKYRLFFYALSKPEFSGQIFKNTEIRYFTKNPSIGSRVAPHGRKDGRLDGQTDEDIRKLRVALRSSAKTPKNESESNSTCFYLRVYIRKAIPLLHKSIKFA